MDVAIFLLFFAVVVGFSLYKSRRGQSSEDYFLAGRGLRWPLIGLSIVAANISTEQLVGMAGQGAGGVGLAVSNWQLVGSVGIVLIAFTLLPRFLRAGIYTMPEFLEYRYNRAARTIMAVITVVIYVAVLLTAVLYSGGLTLRTIFGLELHQAVWLIGLIAAGYTTWGGLRAVAWADLFQGLGLLLGGLTTFYLGLKACGGWEAFSTINSDKLHMVLPADHAKLPWTGVASGMWIVILYYCGLNQFIVQRNLAAKTLRDGQLGVIFAGALWLVVPFAIVMPGIMAGQLYGDQMTRPDEAFPTLIKSLIPAGLRGFMFAAIAGAVVSSLASMLNSASTILTMDVYQPLIAREAPQKRLVLLGRVFTLVFVCIGCLIAPVLDDPRFGGVRGGLPAQASARLRGGGGAVGRSGHLWAVSELRAGAPLPDPGDDHLLDPVCDHAAAPVGRSAEGGQGPAGTGRDGRAHGTDREGDRRPGDPGGGSVLRGLLVTRISVV